MSPAGGRARGWKMIAKYQFVHLLSAIHIRLSESASNDRQIIASWDVIEEYVFLSAIGHGLPIISTKNLAAD
ncbi:MAG: hypothetical protein AAF587_43060 [Bacteroidota bacterium]